MHQIFLHNPRYLTSDLHEQPVQMYQSFAMKYSQSNLNYLVSYFLNPHIHTLEYHHILEVRFLIVKQHILKIQSHKDIPLIFYVSLMIY